MPRLELIAGDAREILEILGAAEAGVVAGAAWERPHLRLGGTVDPTWLDLFAEAVRTILDAEAPSDFLDARIELGAGDRASLTIERVEPAWISAVARVPDRSLDAVAGRWIDRLEEEFGALHAEEKPWIRELAGEVVTFCRAADAERDVVFVWGLG